MRAHDALRRPLVSCSGVYCGSGVRMASTGGEMDAVVAARGPRLGHRTRRVSLSQRLRSRPGSRAARLPVSAVLAARRPSCSPARGSRSSSASSIFFVCLLLPAAIGVLAAPRFPRVGRRTDRPLAPARRWIKRRGRLRQFAIGRRCQIRVHRPPSAAADRRTQLHALWTATGRRPPSCPPGVARVRPGRNAARRRLMPPRAERAPLCPSARAQRARPCVNPRSGRPCGLSPLPASRGP